ncbi:hypothetical protein J8273_8962 [Carpediemonas membranifera]|uniref:Uncharacterized protein n=1 Tax=Carpediemonas membranifera TaxID=201153 RepID=A0A8J6E0R0_9EUKA|nr:hypothetical protein J8273_8962 [Carpediemonas membranifera]|eukprot:KAG9389662.1 hypothetical protein J8273_8962 [Carpediemonas membranifera]
MRAVTHNLIKHLANQFPVYFLFLVFTLVAIECLVLAGLNEWIFLVIVIILFIMVLPLIITFALLVRLLLLRLLTNRKERPFRHTPELIGTLPVAEEPAVTISVTDRIVSSLDHSNAVVVTGSRGSGKTWAVESAMVRLSPKFTHIVTIDFMHGCRAGRSRLLRSLGTALGQDVRPSSGDLSFAIALAISQLGAFNIGRSSRDRRRVLVVLYHLDDASWWLPLFPGASNIKTIVTVTSPSNVTSHASGTTFISMNDFSMFKEWSTRFALPLAETIFANHPRVFDEDKETLGECIAAALSNEELAALRALRVLKGPAPRQLASVLIGTSSPTAAIIVRDLALFGLVVGSDTVWARVLPGLPPPDEDAADKLICHYKAECGESFERVEIWDDLYFFQYLHAHLEESDLMKLYTSLAFLAASTRILGFGDLISNLEDDVHRVESPPLRAILLTLKTIEESRPSTVSVDELPAALAIHLPPNTPELDRLANAVAATNDALNSIVTITVPFGPDSDSAVIKGVRFCGFVKWAEGETIFNRFVISSGFDISFYDMEGNKTGFWRSEIPLTNMLCENRFIVVQTISVISTLAVSADVIKPVASYRMPRTPVAMALAATEGEPVVMVLCSDLLLIAQRGLIKRRPMSINRDSTCSFGRTKSDLIAFVSFRHYVVMIRVRPTGLTVVGKLVSSLRKIREICPYSEVGLQVALKGPDPNYIAIFEDLDRSIDRFNARGRLARLVLPDLTTPPSYGWEPTETDELLVFGSVRSLVAPQLLMPGVSTESLPHRGLAIAQVTEEEASLFVGDVNIDWHGVMAPPHLVFTCRPRSPMNIIAMIPSMAAVVVVDHGRDFLAILTERDTWYHALPPINPTQVECGFVGGFFVILVTDGISLLSFVVSAFFESVSQFWESPVTLTGSVAIGTDSTGMYLVQSNDITHEITRIDIACSAGSITTRQIARLDAPTAAMPLSRPYDGIPLIVSEGRATLMSETGPRSAHAGSTVLTASNHWIVVLNGNNLQARPLQAVGADPIEAVDIGPGDPLTIVDRGDGGAQFIALTLHDDWIWTTFEDGEQHAVLECRRRPKVTVSGDVIFIGVDGCIWRYMMESDIAVSVLDIGIDCEIDLGAKASFLAVGMWQAVLIVKCAPLIEELTLAPDEGAVVDLDGFVEVS